MEESSAKLDPIDLALMGAAFGIVFYLFYPTLKTIALICYNDDDYSHGLLLPVVAVYMIWDNRDKIISRFRKSGVLSGTEQEPAENEYRLAAPAFLLLLGLVLFFIGEVSGISFTSWLAFFPCILSVIFLVFGRSTTLSLSPAVLLLFMAKPLPDSFVVRLFWPLQVFAAKVSAATLAALNVPVHLSGNIIEIPAMKLLVEEACSGMRSCMALLTLALIVVYFVEMSWLSRFAMIVVAIAVAVVLNVFRVALTGILAHFYDPEAATGFFHTFSGLIVFIVGLPILYYCGRLLVKIDSIRNPTNQKSTAA